MNSIGIIGLGKMGLSIVRQLHRHDESLVVFGDISDAQKAAQLKGLGVTNLFMTPLLFPIAIQLG